MQSSGGTNLNVQFSADASKLLGEIKLVDAQLKSLGREIDKALKTGDTARAGELSQQFGRMQTNLAGLNKTAAQTGVIVPRSLNNIASASQNASRGFEDLARSGMGIRRVVAQFSSVEKGLGSIGAIVGGLAGGFVGAFAGQAIVGAVQWMLKSLDSMSEKLTKLQEQAREFGQRPIDVQAFQEMALKVGQSAEAGAKLIAGAGKIVEEALAKAPGPGDIIKIQQGTDGLFHTFKNGVEVVKDLNSPLEILHLNLAKYKNAADPARSATAALLKAFVEFANKWGVESAKVNQLSKEMFNLPAATVLQILPKNFADIDAAINKLAASQRGATAGAEDLNTKLKAVQGNVGIAFQELTAGYQKWLLSLQISSNEWLADLLSNRLPKSFAEALSNIQTNLTNWWQAIADSLAGISSKMFELMLGGWNAFWESVKSLASGVLDWISQKANQVANAIRGAFSAVSGGALGGDPTIPATPMASGGYVRGPGSGTSDSILARVSNGEYVMRARAVDHWGPRFMASLNALRSPYGFAGGGLVMPQRALPRFADGGLVTAGGGAPVHLHLGGREFALSGSVDVVGSLVAHARQQQMRSAGVKPSWYGGRPNN